MSLKPRYRVELRKRTDDGTEDVLQVIDRVFGRVLTKEAAEALIAWEELRNPNAYEPFSDLRLVAFDPEAPRAEVQP